MKLRLIAALPWNLCYDDTDEETKKKEAEAEAAKKKAAEEEDKPVLSQKKVNDLLAAERKKADADKGKLIEQLESFKKAKGLSEQERLTLTSQIDDLKNSMLTKEELSAKERSKLETDYKKTLTEKEQLAARNWGLYQNAIIDTQITQAASAADAYKAHQVLTVLKPLTTMVEDKDEDGKPKGSFTPRVKFPSMKDGKAIELDLTVSEAVKQMKDSPEDYGNYFKSGVVGGLGGSGGSGNVGGAAGGKPPTDPAKYREWRKKNPNL